MTYKELEQQLFGRCKDKRVMGNNTWLERRDTNTLAIRLHSTDILTFTFEPEKVIVNTGGWKTVTTKDRVNKYLPEPWRIYQKNRQWFWCSWHDGNRIEPGLFNDGDWLNWDDAQWHLHASATTKAGECKAEKDRKLIQSVDAYAKLCASKIPLPMPGNGDCWFCLSYDEKNDKTWGEYSQDKDHILSHMSEKYVVPSLVMRAMRKGNVGPFWYHVAFMTDAKLDRDTQVDSARDVVRKAVRKYLSAELGLVR